jgi:hypothetical protein
MLVRRSNSERRDACIIGNDQGLHLHLGVWQRAYRKARSFLHHDILNLESTFVEKQPPISATNQQQQVAMAVLESVMAVLLLAAAAEEEEEEEGGGRREERKKRSCEVSAHGKKSPAPGNTLKRYGSVLPGDKCEQPVSAAAS